MVFYKFSCKAKNLNIVVSLNKIVKNYSFTLDKIGIHEIILVAKPHHNQT